MRRVGKPNIQDLDLELPSSRGVMVALVLAGVSSGAASEVVRASLQPLCTAQRHWPRVGQVECTHGMQDVLGVSSPA